ncbi:MAG TPA: hypothetical protein VF276_10135 [Chloroflexia bacterium]
MSEPMWAWSLSARDTLRAGLETYRLRFGCDPPVILMARPAATELEGIPIHAAAIRPASVVWFGLTCPVSKPGPAVRLYEQEVLVL